MHKHKSPRRVFMNGGASLGANPTLAEVGAAIAAINTAFEEFKTKNDEHIAELRKGNDDVVRREQLDRINQTMTERGAELEEMNRRLAALSTIPAGNGSGDFTAEDRAHTAAISEYMREGLEPDMTASVGSDPDGGYTVGREIESGIERVEGIYSVFRSLAQVRSIGAPDYRKFRNLGGASSGWVSEKESRPQTTTPTLQRMDFPTHEIYAMPAATQTILDDSDMDIAAWLAEEVGIEFAEEEAAAFITGDGGGKPRGLIGGYTPVANGSFDNANAAPGYIATGAAGAFADTSASPAGSPYDKLIDLIHSLKQGLRNGSTFLMNDLTLSVIRKFKDQDGNYIWQPSVQVGTPSQLLGYAVNTDDNMPDIAANSFSVAFGNWRRAYLILDRVGVRVLRDPFTAKPNVLFYTTKRVGGGVQNFEAYKLLRFAAS